MTSTLCDTLLLENDNPFSRLHTLPHEMIVLIGNFMEETFPIVYEPLRWYGCAGSGKTTLAQVIAITCAPQVIRSDAEEKFGLQYVFFRA